MTAPIPIRRPTTRIGLSGGSPEAVSEIPPSPATTRTCTACRYSEPPAGAGHAWVCMHPTSMVVYDPDLGAETAMYCITVRASGRAERCGHSGKYWEAKE